MRTMRACMVGLFYMGLVKAGALATMGPGSMTEVREGEARVVVCNVDGALYAIDNVCPHAGAPLAQGALHGHRVVCPFHAWEFDCRTGECDFNPAVVQRRFAVTIENGDVYVEV